MEKLYLRQKMLAIREKFTFFDANHEKIYKVYRTGWAFSPRYKLVDLENQQLLEVVHRAFPLLPTFKITDLKTKAKWRRLKDAFALNAQFWKLRHRKASI